MKASKKVKVLKPILIFLLISLFSNRAASQSGYHELSVSYGIKSTTELRYNSEVMDIISMMYTFGLGTLETTNMKVTGPVMFSWKYIPKSRWGFGVLAGYTKGSYDEIIGSIFGGNIVSHNKYSAFTIAPETDFRYFQREKLTLYSSAAVGLTILSEEVIGLEEKNNNHFDYHLSLIGLRYGQKLGAFAELGFGFKGLINFGINLKL